MSRKNWSEKGMPIGLIHPAVIESTDMGTLAGILDRGEIRSRIDPSATNQNTCVWLSVMLVLKLR
jgi:hypothetical protein